MNWCFLIPLLVGLTTAFLGYLLGKLGKGGNDIGTWENKVSQLEADLDACRKNKGGITKDTVSSAYAAGSSTATSSDINIWRDKVSQLEAELRKVKGSSSSNIVSKDLDVWKNRVAKLEADLKESETSKKELEAKLKEGEKASTTATKSKSGSAKSSLAASGTGTTKSKSSSKTGTSKTTSKSTTKKTTSSNTKSATSNFDAALAKEAFGKKIKQDDLKVVEGIGPKIEGLFHNHGIKTWKALSEATQAKCNEVLASGGSRYKMHKPDTWPKQAKFAYEGKWKELAKWQDEMDGGRK